MAGLGAATLDRSCLMGGLPARGDRVTIAWPGGTYDFVMSVRDATQLHDGWVLLHGLVVEPYQDVRDFRVRRTDDGGFTLVPARG